jgi:hypothetical protein
MGGVCSIHEGEMHTKFKSENLNVNDHLKVCGKAAPSASPKHLAMWKYCEVEAWHHVFLITATDLNGGEGLASRPHFTPGAGWAPKARRNVVAKG